MKTSKQFWIIISVIISCSILTTILNLYAFKENLLESRKREITTILNFARNQSLIYVEKHKNGLLSREEAENAIIKALSAMNEGSRYIWANDNHAIARVHVRPEVLGKFQSSYIINMNLLKNKDTAFITETNVKPIIEKRVLKINGVTKIPDWNWVIGYGAYLDDIEEEFLDSAIKSILINSLIITIILFVAMYLRRLQPYAE